jgi:deoxyribonuclease V
MEIQQLHDWNLSPTAAVALQKKLAQHIDVRPTITLEQIKLIAGVDVSFNRYNPLFTAGVVILRADTLEVVESAWAQHIVTFPYIPGLLSFREIPVLTEALSKITSEPDVLVVDGQGIAHPRRLGIATHLGLVLQRPTIGVAKSILAGHLSPMANPQPGMTADLIDHDEIIGQALWTKKRSKPVYISPGHLINQSSATHIVQACLRGYRLPEPTRQAHLYVNTMRRQHTPIMDKV